jgi:hypothetical protein
VNKPKSWIAPRDTSIAPIDAQSHRVETVIAAVLAQEFREVQRHTPYAASYVQHPIIGSCGGDRPHILKMTKTKFIEPLASYKVQKPRWARISSMPDVKPEEPIL